MDASSTPLPPRLAVGRTAELFAWEDGRVLKLFNAGIFSGWRVMSVSRVGP